MTVFANPLHSATPWRVVNGPHGVEVRTATGGLVCTMGNGSQQLREADAWFLVSAVNNAYVWPTEALERLLDAVQATPDA